jgi:phosphonate transport system permease protein
MQKTLGSIAVDTTQEVPQRPAFINRRMMWLVIFIGGVIWALWESGIFQNKMVNTGGLALGGRFLSASLNPDLSGEFLLLTLNATLTTLAFAVIGLFLSVIVGFFGGVVVSETWIKSYTIARGDQELPILVRGSFGPWCL